MEAIKDYVRVNGSNLFYAIQGEGKPIIFLHGGFTDHRIWDEQAETFSGHYKVISFDQRGYGNSDIPKGPFSYYEDLKTLIEALALKDVTLIGSSFGGSVAVDFTLKYPELVNKLILAAPALNGYKYPLRYLFTYLKFLSAVKREGFPAAIEKFISDPFWSYFFPSPEKKSARRKVLNLIREAEKSFNWDPRLIKTLKPAAAKHLAKIRIPTLVILPDMDSQFNQKAGSFIHQKIKDSQIIRMSGCGHLPYVEKPEEFNKLVLNFLFSN